MTFKSEFRESIIRKSMVNCKHFNGIHHDQCEAGITYDTSGKFALPCLPSLADKRERLTCESFCVMTKEEAESEADEFERAYQTAVVARKAAKDDAKAKNLGRGNGGRGNLKCPVCTDGILHYTVAWLNGHMHAKCSTAGCVAWME